MNSLPSRCTCIFSCPLLSCPSFTLSPLFHHIFTPPLLHHTHRPLRWLYFLVAWDVLVLKVLTMNVLGWVMCGLWETTCCGDDDACQVRICSQYTYPIHTCVLSIHIPDTHMGYHYIPDTHMGYHYIPDTHIRYHYIPDTHMGYQYPYSSIHTHFQYTHLIITLAQYNNTPYQPNPPSIYHQHTLISPHPLFNTLTLLSPHLVTTMTLTLLSLHLVITMTLTLTLTPLSGMQRRSLCILPLLLLQR